MPDNNPHHEAGGPAGALTLAMPWGELAYRRAGAGAPLVMIHSLALNGAMWQPILADFTAGHEVITVDMRGHGASRWDGGAFTVRDLAEDLCRLLDALAIDTIDLLGLSMGGSVATCFAAAWPSRVRRLALSDTTAWYGPEAPQSWAKRAASALDTPDRRDLLDFQLDRWFSAAFRASEPATVAHIADIFVRTDPRAHAQACRALGDLDERDRLGEITAKTLVITGEEDYATPPNMGEALAQGIAGAEFRLWPGVRHLSPFESGDLREALVNHLDQ
ncbi:MAG: alpha/beta fold hydrolase [Actinomycetia bacterium]|nr:alpha/beta fold hydrolase [Actinomycetes bacterium]